MSLLITILYGFMGFIAFCGIFGEKEPFSRKCYAVCFVICAIIVLVANIIGGTL